MSDAKPAAESVDDVRKKPAGDSRKQLGVLIDPDLQAAIDLRAKAVHETVSVGGAARAPRRLRRGARPSRAAPGPSAGPRAGRSTRCAVKS